MSRVEFSKATKLAAWKRAAGHCEQCGCLFAGKVPHYDHINPEVFSHDATLANCSVKCVSCHDAKTYKQDIPAVAKSNRLRATAAGIRRRRAITAWRSFSGEIVRKPARREE